MNCVSDICTIRKTTLHISKDDVSIILDTISELNAENSCSISTFDAGSFSNAPQLKKVDFSNCNSLTIIPQLLFYQCYKLDTIILPEKGSLETIEGGAFSYSSITSITFPSSLKYLNALSSYDNTGSFSCCTQLTTVNFYSENNLRTVGSYVFRKCPLSTFHVGKFVSQITAVTFEDVPTTFRQITVDPSNNNFFEKDGILYSNDKKLVFCPPGIETIKIIDGIETIGNEAFNLSPMKLLYNLPNSTKVIESWAFRHCTYLESIFLPDSIERISSYAFSYCRNLKSVVLPHSLRSIPGYLFYRCSSLDLIYIPDSITQIDSTAFASTPLTNCGIICSSRMRSFIQSSLNLLSNPFKPCPEETFHCHRFLLVPVPSITLFYIIFS